MRYLITVALAVLLVLSAALAFQNTGGPEPSAYELNLVSGDRPIGEPFATRSPIIAQHGIAATVHPLATQIALETLRQGGNAVDAAIAANAALSVMNPVMCGLGGDLFAIVWDPQTRKLYGLNASGRSPRALTYDIMRQKLGAREQIPLHGPLTLTVPGAVDGWFTLHDRFGSLPMEKILAPAIRYAREGFPVTPVTAHYWQVDGIEGLEADSDISGTLDNLLETFSIDGHAPRAGEVFRNPDLAGTLEQIAEGGRDAFYEGPIAETIDSYMRRIGGYLRKEDLADYHSTWVDPISTEYRGYRVWELPPNSQGAVVLEMLNILEGYDLANMGHNSADYVHVMTEAKKLAFADRSRYYGDPDFGDLPITQLISQDYADQRRSLIDMDHASMQVAPGNVRMEDGDTIYLTVADESGMMVSLIESNFQPLGSGLVPDGLGFVLQDRGALFTMEKGHPDVYAPGKRPFHTIIPAFVTRNGEPFLSFGVMGGDTQPQGQVQILCNIIDFGMNVQEAGDAPRWLHSGSSSPTGLKMANGGTVKLEMGISPEVAQQLRERGHQVERGTGFYGGYQAIMRDAQQEVYWGASEMRQDGQAAGY
ncbi:MAG TPA: gamma-glutamyltransferase [Rhodothermales bacterium]|nr:gamma-glutamyltransferase [Rhodothermales bacterium]